MNRVVVYVDGFNLYHAIADLRDQSLKWLDLWKLSASLLRADETLASVNYFSAFATWLVEPYARHRAYVQALKAKGVNTFMGKFKEKPRSCRSCGAKWTAHEEKETDVHIAVRVVADALLDEFDRAIIVSADSDLAPALRAVRQHRPKKEILVVAPPGRYASARDLGPKLELRRARLRRCLLPARLQTASGKLIVRPREYDP
ncbi:MAG TPA: NYN domain-containing protein [Rhodospirillales bacterium]|jgi:hypothetical protein|nr:NYN domain-containing protein [Rhodospirillales bacterium]